MSYLSSTDQSFLPAFEFKESHVSIEFFPSLYFLFSFCPRNRRATGGGGCYCCPHPVSAPNPPFKKSDFSGGFFILYTTPCTKQNHFPQILFTFQRMHSLKYQLHILKMIYQHTVLFLWLVFPLLKLYINCVHVRTCNIFNKL